MGKLAPAKELVGTDLGIPSQLTRVLKIGLKMIYFINENPNPKEIGDLEVYKNKNDLLSELESWYVDVGHLVFNVDGDCFRVIANDGALALKPLRTFISKDVVFECMHYLLAGSRPHHPLEKIKMVEDHRDYKIEV